MLKKRLLLFLVLFLFSKILFATDLHVGANHPYPTLSAAISVVMPGDTIIVHAGLYAGGLTFTNLKGTAVQWITIRGVAGETVIFEGGTNSIQFVEPAYLHLKGLIFQHQTGNGLNTDDGGTYDTPAHHIVFESCTFRDMEASGNNDLLKLSGLDFFEVRNCIFLNGAEGGSGIDMVGCHQGLLTGCRFENMGTNAIQAKGGTEHIRIERNFFKNGGQRTLNLGGSTGLQFFRPDTAHFEAANLKVYSNIFIGSWAPIAYVGSVGVEVMNNTFYQPEHWVIRILQETVDPDRFLPCGDNTFRNNIIYLGNSVVTETNTGPNTAPETFTFSNNLWFNYQNPNWSGPDLPVADINNLVQLDPLFADAAAEDFSIPVNSPATGAGFSVADPTFDFSGQIFADPPAIGALESQPVSGVKTIEDGDIYQLKIYPNPAQSLIFVQFTLKKRGIVQVELFDMMGRNRKLVFNGFCEAGDQRIPVEWEGLPGLSVLNFKVDGITTSREVIRF